MYLSDQKLESMTEGALLEVALGYVRVKYPNEKPRAILADLIGKTEMTISNIISDQTCLSPVKWFIIEQMIQEPIFWRWCNVQREKFLRSQ
jgi:hypothetical protein